MQSKKVPHIGMRTFKTALAVTLALLVGQKLGLDTPIFAAIGAVSVMERTVKDSLSSGISHLLGTLLGFLAGSFYVLIVPDTTNILFIGVALLLIIAVCVHFRFPDAVSLTCVVFISQGFQAESVSLSYGFSRFLAAVVGICIALLINILIKPYNNRKQLQNLFREFLDDLPTYVFDRIVHERYPDLSILKAQLKRIDKELDIYDAQHFSRHEGHEEQLIFLRGCYQLAERTFHELSAFCTIDEAGMLLHTNAYHLKKMCSDLPKLPTIEQANSNVDVVYNYHLAQLLSSYFYLHAFLQ